MTCCHSISTKNNPFEILRWSRRTIKEALGKLPDVNVPSQGWYELGSFIVYKCIYVNLDIFKNCWRERDHFEDRTFFGQRLPIFCYLFDIFCHSDQVAKFSTMLDSCRPFCPRKFFPPQKGDNMRLGQVLLVLTHLVQPNQECVCV